MGAETQIGWTDATFNPIGGCSLASPGCTHCYAQRIAGSPRLRKHPLYKGVTTEAKTGPIFNGKLTVAPDDHPIWTWPIRWRGSQNPKAGPGMPSMIFVGDMSDLFHEMRPTKVIDKVVASLIYSRHICQLLTKRVDVMKAYFSELQKSGRWLDFPHPMFGKPNFDPAVAEYERVFSRLWLGVSTEDQTRANERIPDLLATPAAVRFVSYEPALGPIDFTEWLHDSNCPMATEGFCTCCEPREISIDQIIYGGESGPDRRDSKIEWAESTMRQCKGAGTKFHFKQDGSLRAGARGRANDELLACKEFPVGPPPGEMAAGIIHEPGRNGETDPAQGELL